MDGEVSVAAIEPGIEMERLCIYIEDVLENFLIIFLDQASVLHRNSFLQEAVNLCVYFWTVDARFSAIAKVEASLFQTFQLIASDLKPGSEESSATSDQCLLHVDICIYRERTVKDNFVGKGLPNHVRDE